MPIRHRPLLRAVAALAVLAAAAPPAPTPVDCAGGYCTLKMTAPELLKASEQLVLAKRYEEARPLVAALGHAPELTMERHFLEGYIAAETGDLPAAVKQFRAVLAMQPDMTRARLELARALMMQGKDKAADYHYRLAENAGDLPPEVSRTIYAARSIIRDRRRWDLNVDIGFAPDTNINNATSDRTVDVLFGNTTLPLTLDANARRTTGLGQTATVSGGVRLRLSDGLAVVVDADGRAVNYGGTAADDISSLIAAGPELTFTNGVRVVVQALGSQRWYGGKVAARSVGGRANVTANLGDGARAALQLEARHVNSGFSANYDGMQYSAYLSLERVIERSLVASLTGFVRREPLRAEAFSNTEFGLIAGVGGELPWGLNAGLSAQGSRATFDAAQLALSPDPRRDWRLQGRAYVGARNIRVLGFSPSATYTYSNTRSNYSLYRFDRHRAEITLSRFF